MFKRSLLTLTVAATLSASVIAGAPQQKTSAPGYYRMMLGDTEVTALSDGTTQLPVHQLLQMDADKVRDKLAEFYRQSPLETSVNAYLVNDGDSLVLIDTGAGSMFGASLGNLVRNIEAAGYSADDIDEVYITHMHSDHIGGLVNEGKRVFTNATIRADKHDADYWLSQQQMEQVPEAQRGGFKGAMTALNPYVEAGQFKPFVAGETLAANIKSVEAYGHTPGHTMYRLDAGDQTLVFWGDIMHVAEVQFDQPSVTIAFDSNQDEARERRITAYADAAKEGYYVAGAHLPFPGMGQVKSDGDAYDWVPVNYSPMW
ncbi:MULTISPECIES: MBL fold metallo-hydrolase [unclassified Idiomarina]|uniref:MBL fold metallo-hydrolase n=1 Tax=unclassified Idiomarina TaxID=2614829 RepID=UPI000C8B9C44|nr:MULTISPECIES: MBL fold metallo-hydrolase [unclassified Idiomarina]MAD53967.1 MBL fold metallo-hydrolase [Idiomarinaceae bacterium]MEC7644278.1 MBL fold metallo-hydrolase [Pseudomonadota bacterium]NQZ03789.1 MBL fold metallo-hydrolase [Idiomarina sp.]|tara:strand:+ start:1010 stop:1954 length:945 start_codon:yes stop_codon:yes gene_type:complete